MSSSTFLVSITVHTHAHTHVYTHAHMQTPTHTCAYTCTCTHTHTQAQVHTLMHTLAHTRTHICAHTHKHLHTHAHTHKHTHTLSFKTMNLEASVYLASIFKVTDVTSCLCCVGAREWVTRVNTASVILPDCVCLHFKAPHFNRIVFLHPAHPNSSLDAEKQQLQEQHSSFLRPSLPPPQSTSKTFREVKLDRFGQLESTAGHLV